MTALLDERPTRDTIAAPHITPASPRRQIEPGPVRVALRRSLLLLTVYAMGLVGYVFAASHLIHARAQTSLDRRFASELANAVAPVNQPVPAGAPVALLQIPSIGFHEIIVEGSNATQLMRGPGHVQSTTLPGQPGTSIVLCRRATYGAPCADLDRMDDGDTLTVTNGQGIVEYRVVERTVFDGDDARAFAGRGNALVLITMDEAVLGTNRLTVVAEPLTQQARGTRIPSGPLSADELGLAGDRNAAALVLVWLEVLAVIALGTVVLFRRWARGPAYLVAIPPLLAATWLSYEHISRLLPGLL